MVRIRQFNNRYWLVDDGDQLNGRTVLSIKTSGKIEGHTEDRWLIFPDAYTSFVGNHAIIHPNPTPITKALHEMPLKGVDDGA